MVALGKALPGGESSGKGLQGKLAEDQSSEVSILIQAGQGEGMAGKSDYLHRNSPEAGSSGSEIHRHSLGHRIGLNGSLLSEQAV